jgi:hypothetical protein
MKLATTPSTAFIRVALLVVAAACGSSESRPAALQNTESPAGASGDSTLCAHLHPGAEEDPGIVDAQLQCGRYRDELLPPVAAKAVACMEAARWDVCKLSPCTMAALETQPPDIDACEQVTTGCPAMTELCATHIGGMNARGRQRFTSCIVENCGNGVRFCLWDPMVSPCD